jgi:hypothetical protein
MQAAALVLVIALAPADASPPVDGPPSPSAVQVSDAGELQGEWAAVSVVIDGIDYSRHFRGYREVYVGWTLREFDGGRLSASHTFRVDNYSTPPFILLLASGQEIGRRAYRCSADELLRTNPGVVLTFRRVKK